jgi:hypothetical protein
VHANGYIFYAKLRKFNKRKEFDQTHSNQYNLYRIHPNNSLNWLNFTKKLLCMVLVF